MLRSFTCERLPCDFEACVSVRGCVCVRRQPPSVRLFPTAPGFVAVSEAVLAGASCSCLLVAAQAAAAASALFRYTYTHTLRIRK